MTNDRSKPSTEQAADLLDVHILDLAAQIEALLRSVREIQHGVLAARGVCTLPGNEVPGAHVQRRLQLMLEESETLRAAIVQARKTARHLSSRDPVT